MKTTIGVYESHDEAVEAAGELRDANFPMKHVSIIGQTENIKHKEQAGEEGTFTRKAGESVGISALVGSTLGVLTGVGIFAIPGLGFLFGAGAIVGAIAGLDVGLITGGIIGALTIGLSKEHHEKYERHLKEGNFLLIVHGQEQEINRAKDILHEHGKHIGLEIH